MLQFSSVFIYLFVTFIAFICAVQAAEEVFTTRGSIAKVDLAMKAVSKGSTVFASKATDGIVVWYEDVNALDHNHLLADTPGEKVLKLSESLFVIGTGFAADYNYLKREIISKVLSYSTAFGKDISARYLSNELSEILFQQTRNLNARPLGVSMIVGGIESDGKVADLIEIDAYGNRRRCGATCLGRKSTDIMDKWKLKVPTMGYSSENLMFQVDRDSLSNQMLRCLIESYENIDDSADDKSTPVINQETISKFVKKYNLRSYFMKLQS